jgi:catechol-2,3-dioxygenase
MRVGHGWLTPGGPSRPATVFLRSATPSSNHHDLALIANAEAGTAKGAAGLFHVAFEVGTLDELDAARDRLHDAGSLDAALDQGMHLSLYCTDPDGIAVEVIWRAPDHAWSYDDALARHPLDLEAARARWGGDLATGAAAGTPA